MQSFLVKRARRIASRIVTLLCLAATFSPRAAAVEPDAVPTPSVEATPTKPAHEVDEHRARPEAFGKEPEDASDGTRTGAHLYWEHGLNYGFLRPVRVGNESHFVLDGALGLNGRIGVKLGVDVAGYLEHGSLPDLGTRFDLRRATIYTTGEFHLLLPILFKIDVGGIGDSPYLSDIYLWLRDVPYVGALKLGQFDAPMSLEMMTGSTYSTFMEYGSPVEAFSPGLKVGVQISDHSLNDRATWAFGYFTDGQKVDVGDTSVTRRSPHRTCNLAGTPTTDGRRHARAPGSERQLRAFAERSHPIQLAPGKLPRSKARRYRGPRHHVAFPFGMELAVKRGPFTFQAEYMASAVDAGSPGDAYLDGAYGSASWFLTGEQRDYDTSTGKIGALMPTHDFSFTTATGAPGRSQREAPGSISPTDRSTAAA